MQYVVSTLLQELFINTIAEGHGICLQDVPSSTQPTPCPPALRLASDFHSNKKRRNGHLCMQCPLLDVRVLPGVEIRRFLQVGAQRISVRSAKRVITTEDQFVLEVGLGVATAGNWAFQREAPRPLGGPVGSMGYRETVLTKA